MISTNNGRKHVLYALLVMEGELQATLGKRRMIKAISKLKQHIIICGFGRIGQIRAHAAIENKLRHAGAHEVIMPAKIGASTIAGIIAKGDNP